MWLTIHRGSKEIGGSCIELSTRNSRVILDMGWPLVDANGGRFDCFNAKHAGLEQLKKDKILPDIQGIYEAGNNINAIFISHSHLDHYGIVPYADRNIPVYSSKGTKKLLQIANYFGQTTFNADGVIEIEPWQLVEVGDFHVTPYLVDHSGFDAFGYLIEADGCRLFYSGDFRAHGRKRMVFERLLKRPPEKIDYLLLEGSMLGRDTGTYVTEQDIEKRLIELLKIKGRTYFISCSSQNIDRIVSAYRACLQTGRELVIDPYTAYILDTLKDVSPGLPQFDWEKGIRVFFAQNSHTARLAEDKTLFKYKSAKISREEIAEKLDTLLIKDNYFVRSYFARMGWLVDASLIYSMWEGYLSDVQAFWDSHNVPIVQAHCSGHAYIEDLKRLVHAMNPGQIIPNHTFHPERYSELFGDRVLLVNDGQLVSLQQRMSAAKAL